MSHPGALLRRVLILSSLSITLFATVVLLSIATNAQASANAAPKNPKIGETWAPTPGSSVFITGLAQLVVTMTPPTMDPFTITNVVFRVVLPALLGPYPVISSYLTTIAGSYVVVTATNFPFTLPGEQVQFLVTYYTASSPATTASVNYNVSGVYQRYMPAVLNRFGGGGGAGNDPCSAGKALSLTDYSLVQDGPYKFFSLTVPTTSTVVLTVTGYPIYGQMQLRTPPASPSCVTTGTQYIVGSSVISTNPSLSVYNVASGTYLARFSSDNGITSPTPFTFRWQYSPGGGLFGANDNSCSAPVVNLNTPYQEYPYKTEDWFAFDVTSTQNISIAVNNYTANGQIVLYQKTGTCSSIQLVDNAGFTNNSAIIPTTNLAAGRYYLRVYTTSGNNTTALYNFKIYSDYGYVPVVWAPIANRCPTWDGCSDHTNNGTFSEIIYWAGAPGATEIKVEFKHDTVVRNTCNGGNDTSMTFNSGSSPSVGSLTPSGNYTFNGLTQGYYIVWVTISRPGFATYQNTMGVKVNCDFLLLAQSPWPASTATPIAPVIGPVLPPVAKPTPPPLPMDLPQVKATPAP